MLVIRVIVVELGELLKRVVILVGFLAKGARRLGVYTIDLYRLVAIL